MRFQLRSKNAYAVFRSRRRANIMSFGSSVAEEVLWGRELPPHLFGDEWFPVGAEIRYRGRSADPRGSPPGRELALCYSRDDRGFLRKNDLAVEGSPPGNDASWRLLLIRCQAHEDVLHRAAGLLEVLWRVPCNDPATIQYRQPIAPPVGLIHFVCREN